MSLSNADDITDQLNMKLRLVNKRSTEISINQATCHCADCWFFLMVSDKTSLKDSQKMKKKNAF